jgi:hypothetical protein
MTPIRSYGTCDSAATAALAAALAAVEDNKQTGRLERELSKSESALRQMTLEHAAKKLDEAATRQVIGAAVSGAFLLASAGCQAVAAGETGQLADVMKAQSQLNQALSKSGDIISATAGYSQADKTRLDKLAESQQQTTQDAERGRTRADDAAKQSLADAREVLRLLRDSAQATRRA